MATSPDELDPKKQLPQLGMTLSPSQQRQQRVNSDMQRASSRIQETKQGLRKAAGAVGDALGTAAGAVVKAGTVVPRTIAGVATGDIPLNVSHLPDYGNKGVEQTRSANWAKNNPDQAESARLGMKAVADRASSAAIGQVKAAQPAAAPGMPALGLKAPTAKAPAPDAGPAAPVTAAPTSDAGPQGQPGLGFQRTAVDGVVGRTGADGTMEFSNAAGDVEGASDSQMKAGRMGNGVGSLSVGEPGDSAMAMDRYARASEIRAGTNRLRRQGTLGDNGNFTIVRDSSKPITRDDMNRARLEDIEQRRTADLTGSAADRQMRERELEAGLGFRSRELDNAEQASQLEQQRLGMELETGALGLAQQRQIQQLREQLADPSLDAATRQQVERAYNALTTPAKDRYVLQDTVMGQDALGAPVFGKQALDVTNGQLVGQGQQAGQAPAAAPQFQVGKLYKDASGNRARYMGTDAQGNPQWEQL